MTIHVEHLKAALARRAKEAGLTVAESPDAQLQERDDAAACGARSARGGGARADRGERWPSRSGITDEHGLPAAYAVARELTQRHLGGRPVKLVDAPVGGRVGHDPRRTPHGSARHRWGVT